MQFSADCIWYFIRDSFSDFNIIHNCISLFFVYNFKKCSHTQTNKKIEQTLSFQGQEIAKEKKNTKPSQCIFPFCNSVCEWNVNQVS